MARAATLCALITLVAGCDEPCVCKTSFLSAIVTVVAYEDPVHGSCPTSGAGVAAVLTWGPTDNNSLMIKKAAALSQPVRGFCIILTDHVDSVAPWSERSSGQVDFIELRNREARVNVILEEFERRL